MKKNKEKKKASAGRGWLITGAVIYVLAAVVWVFGNWYKNNITVTFDALYFTLRSPLEGTSSDILPEVGSFLPQLLAWLAVLVLALVLLGKNREKKAARVCRKAAPGVALVLLVGSLVYAAQAVGLPAYLKASREGTTIYEDYYVDPLTVDITAEGETKNLLLIYLESMETTYASAEDGGIHEVNYIPNMTALAKENLYFSSTGLLGGYHNTEGTGWTMGALLATTSGVPFAFPTTTNGMWERSVFASGLTTLGDILETKGYNQEFMCGSEGVFGGRTQYFTQHGGYKMMDIFQVKEEGYLPEDYGVWWGFEDFQLYDIAKQELLKLAAQDEPFNMTMLTVDTHYPVGYFCDLCQDEFDSTTASILACADRQLQGFIDWCREQDFYEDTVIVIVGDHPRMDTVLVEGVDYYDRTTYNCFINVDVTPAQDTGSRVFTPMDMFPTVLRAMGFNIEGSRLGLGTDMFSDLPTLAEEMGFDQFNAELGKTSAYYLRTFT